MANLETLILAVTSRLFVLRHHPSFPDPEIAPEKDALNCIRVLTRILPFLYEADNLEAWEDKFFWGARRKRTRRGQISKSEVLFDESLPDGDQQGDDEDFEDVKPLAEELIDTLVDLLFYAGFTLPTIERSKHKVTYAIWQSGVGCNTPMSSSKELENNRTEILRLLLTLSSKAMYMPASQSDEILHLRFILTSLRHTACERRQSYHLHRNLPGQAGGIVDIMLTSQYCK